MDLKADDDRLHELINQYTTWRQMWGYGLYDPPASDEWRRDLLRSRKLLDQDLV